MNFWIVKCSLTAHGNSGWSWDWYFGEDDVYPRDGDWGGPDWIRSAASRQFIKQVRKGDLVVCYQFEGRRICGLTYMTGNGRVPKGSGGYCMLNIAAGHKALNVDPELTIAELRQTGCDPKYFGPGSQGTIFPLTNDEFEGVVLAIREWRPEIWPELESWLERVGYGRSHERLAELRMSLARRGGGFAVDPVKRVEVEKAAVKFVRRRMESQGWNVESVERLYCGYDLLCQKSRKRRDIEVKGVSSTVRAFPITGGEVREAETNGNFHISIVTNALSRSPDCEELSGREFLKAYGLTPIQYMARPKERSRG